MKSHDHLVFLLELLVLLATSRILGELVRRLHQPAVVGELIAGLIIGPSILGKLAPELHASLFPTPHGELLPPALEAFTLLGSVLLMLAAGLEVDLSMCLREKRATVLCALFGSIIPLVIGLAAGWAFAEPWGLPSGGSRFAFSLTMGISLALSALPVIAKTLLDLGIQRDRIGVVILSAAMIDDVGVWMLFSVAMSLAGHGAEMSNPFLSLILLLGFILVAFTLVRSTLNRLLPRIQASLPWPSGIIAVTVATGIAFAVVSIWIGVHPVFGALLAGVVIGNAPGIQGRSKETVHDFVMSVFAPIFFASIGLRIDFVEHFAPGIVAATLALGCGSKLLGASAGARLSGFRWRESLAIAAGLNARGIMGIVLGLVALELRIIDQRMFVALAILGVATSIVAGPSVRWLLGPPFFARLRERAAQVGASRD